MDIGPILTPTLRVLKGATPVTLYELGCPQSDDITLLCFGRL